MNSTDLLSIISSSSSSLLSSSSSTMANNIDLDTINQNTSNNSNFDKFGSLSQNYSLLLSQLEKLAINSVLSSTVKPLSTTFQNSNNNNNNNNNNNFQQQHQNLLQQLQLTQQQLLQQYSGFNNNFNLHNNNNGGINFHSSFSSSSSSTSDILNEDTTSIHTITDAEYSRFISDIWIGIVLTLLILSIVFFICSCFLYHKFQQWKNSYRTSNSEPEIIRRYDIDVESLPSYTLVSGLPTYDDAIEQFRKAGILIQQPSVIKIFEDISTKVKPPLPISSDNDILRRDNLTTTTTTTTIRNSNENLDNNNPSFDTITNNVNNINTNRNESITNNDDNTLSDNISINSFNYNTEINSNYCNNNDCNTSNRTTMSTITGGELSRSSTTLSNLSTSIIELNPEQLRMLSQKRLSLQITLNNLNTNNNSNLNVNTSNLRLTANNCNNNNHYFGRGKIDLFREISRNNLLRSHDVPRIHRSTASLNNDERSYDMAKKRLMRNLQHRGSLS